MILLQDQGDDQTNRAEQETQREAAAAAPTLVGHNHRCRNAEQHPNDQKNFHKPSPLEVTRRPCPPTHCASNFAFCISNSSAVMIPSSRSLANLANSSATETGEGESCCSGAFSSTR